MVTYYAHSGNEAESVPPQPYHEHVENVRGLAIKNVDKLLKNSTLYSGDIRDFIIDVVTLSALYHDLGKLDSSIQPVLSAPNPSDARLLNHVDAGVAYLLKKFKETNHTAYLISAFFVLSHHLGLHDWFEVVDEKISQSLFSRVVYQIKKNFRCQYNLKKTYAWDLDITLEAYVDSKLSEYEHAHHALIPEYTPVSPGKKIQLTTLQLRMAFSCFVDADHQDTASHFSNHQYTVCFPLLQASERIKKLDEAVKVLSEKKQTSSEKRIMRTQLYELCSNIPTDKSYYLIDATVGNAKTVAAIKAALKIAEVRGQDRIYSVAPFTNIIHQTVDVYKSSVSLDTDPPYAINEIHSKVEIEVPHLRMGNNIWNSPINVTTAVQFIESLVKHNTTSIRKLHLFANSVVILDEFHSFIPHDQWNYILEIMRDLAQNFNTVFIFSSGSSVLYWELYDKTDMKVHEVVPQELYTKMLENELKRVKIHRHPTPFNSLDQFSQTVFTDLEENGYNSAMIVVNTIKTAVTLTQHFVLDSHGYRIFHLSSFLVPTDRKRILKQIRRSLGKEKIILTSTSIVECGVDMSFECGYRQLASLSSIIQFSGRINREQIHPFASTTVFEFDKQLRTQSIVTENPMFSVGKQVVDTLSDDQLTPEYCTYAADQEILRRNTANNPNRWMQLETSKCFRTIGERFHVIASNTIVVIVDPKVIEDIKNNKYVPYRRIMNASVQLWFTKLVDPRFQPHIQLLQVGEKDYYIWTGPYDPVFGIGIVF